MAEQRSYHAPDLDVETLGEALFQWYQSQGFEAQKVAGPNGAVIVQARKEDTWRTVAGLSAALSVELVLQGENLFVRAGAAKWADKAVVGVLTALFFFPLLALPAWGAYKQKELIDDTLRFIERYVVSGGQVPREYGVVPGAVSEPWAGAPQGANQAPRMTACPQCGAQVRGGARFCDNCGAALVVVCPECKAELRAGARFCDACGAQLTQTP